VVSSSRAAKLVGALSILLAGGPVALAALGTLCWNRVEVNGERAARTELTPLAEEQIP
jgi:Mce-associated membrane protein